MDAKVTNVTFGIDDPNKGAETARSLADAHVADQFRWMDSQLRIVKDHRGNND